MEVMLIEPSDEESSEDSIEISVQARNQLLLAFDEIKERSAQVVQTFWQNQMLAEPSDGQCHGESLVVSISTKQLGKDRIASNSDCDTWPENEITQEDTTDSSEDEEQAMEVMLAEPSDGQCHEETLVVSISTKQLGKYKVASNSDCDTWPQNEITQEDTTDSSEDEEQATEVMLAELSDGGSSEDSIGISVQAKNQLSQALDEIKERFAQVVRAKESELHELQKQLEHAERTKVMSTD